MDCNTSGEITAPLGEGVSVAKRHEGNRLTLVVRMQTGSDCVLHWGLTGRSGGGWQRPPDAVWPRGTAAVNGHAVNTPLAPNPRGEREVAIQLELPCPWKNLPFVLYFPKEKRWLKSGGRDFSIVLPRSGNTLTAEQALEAWMPFPVRHRQVFTLDGGERLATATCAGADQVRVCIVSDVEGPLVLHWGLAWRFRHEWQLPPERYWPAGTRAVDQKAVHTPFAERDGLWYLELVLPKNGDGPQPRGLKFVLHRPEGTAWLKSSGKDLYVPLHEPEADPRLPSPRLRDLAECIVGAEVGTPSWTLMHRFNLCHELLDGAATDADALALLFAWLRYSALRQLDWQRCYNTKPRELSHAQDRLTSRLAGLWLEQPAGASSQAGAGRRLWLRLLLTTLGRGGDGQRVRDEILHIMHRNHLKEVHGQFVEEWHQKLHNNTTPDDIVICEAYLVFLRSNGDVSRFYQTLQAGGVTRERLQSFERPLRTDPEFYPDRRNALINEFESFLRILKSVHAGTDLETAVAAARGRLDVGLQQKLDGLLSLRYRGAAAGEVTRAVIAARQALRGVVDGCREPAALRDLLFLDLALEEVLRAAIERQNFSQSPPDQLVDLVDLALRNLSLSIESQELNLCAGHWSLLSAGSRQGRDWALHAKSVADRAARWIQGFTGDLCQQLQPKAEVLGGAFAVEPWTIPLFSEEVVRGGPVFALSLLLRHLDPLLRKAAGLGGWQVISPAAAEGRVRVAERLRDIQGERCAEATVLVAQAVGGDEEIPEGVTAILTADTPDLVSHVAVRARNVGVLFATCLEREVYQQLQSLTGKLVTLHVTPAGDVQFSEAAEMTRQGDKETGRQGDRETSTSTPSPSPCHLVTLSPCHEVLTQDKFTPAMVGAKANNLIGLRGKLPDWIRLPTSLALPFRAFEGVLEDDSNRELRAQVEALLATVERDPTTVLSGVRALLLQMKAPVALRASLQEAWQRAGLAAVSWEQAWHSIQRVWASKWNERAYFSRRARGIGHDSLRMAVLMQQVIEADYAYVIHTVNPLTGNRDEIFAEVVLGLGETLVGNYPGRALAFTCRKGDLALDILSYPSKSVGLYGKGVIFRSDSNGEDLEGFAGAGLYDSFLAEEPQHRALDYTREPLVLHVAFRSEMLRCIARVGLEVEKVIGSPQDIEGAVTGGHVYVVQTRPQVGLTAG
jgi:alpha-glucan,water dikinase